MKAGARHVCDKKIPFDLARALQLVQHRFWHDMTFNVLFRAISALHHGQAAGFHAVTRVKHPRTSGITGLLDPGCGYLRALQRASSNSAIKHLISGTSTTHWLYNDAEPVHESPQLANQGLLNLVKAGKYGAADRLRLELLDRGVEITPHPTYEQAAIANLTWSNMDQCLNHFETWFSLVPDYDKASPPVYPGPFKDIRNVLVHAGSPSELLPLILRFGIISASKGYLRPMFYEILPILIRFTSSDDVAEWLVRVEQAAVQYQSQVNSGEALWKTSKRYRAYAVEICCQTGSLDYAVAILQLERDFTLPSRTYTLLTDLLQEAGRTNDIETVERFRNLDAAQVRPDGRLGEYKRPSFCHDILPQPHIDDISNLIDSSAVAIRGEHTYKTLHVQDVLARNVTRRNVAIQLRFFKRWLFTKAFPDTLQTIRFLADFRTVGGSTRVITWLRHRALAASPYCNMAWMKAELRYHNTERNYAEILRLYLTYVDTSNTRAVTLSGNFPDVLQRIAEQHDLPMPSNNQSPLPQPDEHGRRQGKSEANLLPDNYLPKYVLRDRWLILKAIIRLSPSLPSPLPTLNALYASYREATDGVETFNREANEVLAAFIAALGECGGTVEAIKVMKDSGETPYLRQVETLAGVLARAGGVKEAMKLVRSIERGADTKGSAHHPGSLRVKGYDGKVIVAEPRLTTYGMVIGGFVEAGLLEPALEVMRMMKKRFKYSYGLNRKLDEAMRGLWALEMDEALKQVRLFASPSPRLWFY
ncbi:hypothetical protein DXG03_003635 [Asterophora parasitica]|uniref:Pentatricopeptide repeat domain-containing protein n=1 Tax=Asterophora parasitica TaxID=117018 RepID=A0A9P7G7G1_9AGAR|nr:hypothetical protein DXG03_003635 [Asterophora parasitica]